ncbi:adenosylcobinamide-GDP ribazoletransferase [Caulobacter rhizosphaerae]|jgi:adenosylcobinamide-GDP ribazoletransferase|uniref:Adenosylcobinamide-GDP ribazoletransferase n=1 Tax=Caulobacter rhizosphaerae TaxID=2010972 RepID=A0ABU1MYW3_9CAUL|nr:adenosylcobinamide-GDP ribazoletransferase [Caulobacter rhizosphaerae]MDR6531378.1 adenosylcobinamide-GDP ribazoletransferase [Caulobacter rhizosphaerae]
MPRQLKLFFCALQFLTRLPAPSFADFQPDWITRAARYFPLVGILVGAIGAGVLLAAGQLWSGPLPALLAVAAGVLVTGGFHEDGLADTADGLGGGQTPARRLEIMKDSRIGTYGVLALGLVLALKVAALATLPLATAGLALVAAHGAGRVAAVAVMVLGRHVSDRNDAKYKPTPDGVRPFELLFAAGLGLWPLALLGWAGLAGAAVGAVLAAVVALTARRLIGGHTGDVLGGVEQACELGVLLGVSATLAAR